MWIASAHIKRCAHHTAHVMHTLMIALYSFLLPLSHIHTDTHTHTVHNLIPIQVYVANIEDSMACSSRVSLVIGLVFVYTLRPYDTMMFH